MSSSFDRYSKDIAELIRRGKVLEVAMTLECFPDQRKHLNADSLKKVPPFAKEYQSWYSEALACIAQLLPQRLDDFKSLFSTGKVRKEITAETYTVKDYLTGLTVSQGAGAFKEITVPPSTAIPYFKQQLHIVESLEKRFQSSLFDIRLLLQADLFDDELEVAQELNRRGFTRAAGAVAGVVLESHLKEVGERHTLKIPKNANLGVVLESLKSSETVDTPEWRRLQHLTDSHNLCDHKMESEPTRKQVDELIAGTQKTVKTIF